MSRSRGAAGLTAPTVRNLIVDEEEAIEMETNDPVKVCRLRSAARKTAKVSDLIPSEGESSDSEVFGDISDNSDIFHVATDESVPPRTPEDVDLALIDTIAGHLREYPLLPPDVRDPQGEQVSKMCPAEFDFLLSIVVSKAVLGSVSKRMM